MVWASPTSVAEIREHMRRFAEVNPDGDPNQSVQHDSGCSRRGWEYLLPGEAFVCPLEHFRLVWHNADTLEEVAEGLWRVPKCVRDALAMKAGS